MLQDFPGHQLIHQSLQLSVGFLHQLEKKGVNKKKTGEIERLLNSRVFSTQGRWRKRNGENNGK
jgi:hypothetical protein